MHHLRCVSCEGASALVRYGPDWWCATCIAEGRQSAFEEAQALVASILAERRRRVRDLPVRL